MIHPYIKYIADFFLYIGSKIHNAWVKRIRQRDPIQKQIKKNEGIRLWMQQMHNHTNERPTRTAIWLFHNGGTYYTGKSMQKMSMFGELTELQTSPSVSRMQNIPIFYYQHALHILASNPVVGFSDVSKIPDATFRGMLEFERATSWYAFAIKDPVDRFLGIYAVQFNTNVEMDNAEKIHIQMECDKMGQIL